MSMHIRVGEIRVERVGEIRVERVGEIRVDVQAVVPCTFPRTQNYCVYVTSATVINIVIWSNCATCRTSVEKASGCHNTSPQQTKV